MSNISNMYDPFVDREIASHQPSADSYWQSTTSSPVFPTLESDKQVDVVIVGGGYTGLNCAINLAQQGVTNIALVDANSIGWGCSSRNAGFVLPGSGRLSYQQLTERFGKTKARVLHEQYMGAIDLVKTRIALISDQADKTENGYLKLAHSPKWFSKLANSADYLSQQFDYEVETFSKTEFQSQFVNHQKVYGAIRYKNGFGVNPLKLVNQYAKMAKDLGVKLYSNSPVVDLQHGSNNSLKIITERGAITANKVVIATNGYTPKGLNTPLANKILPVLTSVIVTRPLTPEELSAANFLSHQVMMDTRELKYYYRLLPDNRILFGGRSAISGKAASNPKYQQRLLKELKETFVGLDRVSIDYVWSGWISVAFDEMPHLYKTADNIYYATGYCGSGVSFSAWAGNELANLVIGKSTSSPLYSELPKFPFAPFRRIGQSLFYQYGRVKDALG